MVNFGTKLKLLRDTQKMSQKQLADRLGVAPNSISAYESGTRFPTYETLIKISAIFHVTCDYLLGLERRNTIDVSCLLEDEKHLIIEMVHYLTRKRTDK